MIKNRIVRIKRYLWLLLKLNIFQFIWFNFFSKKVYRLKGALIYPFHLGKICLEKGATIVLNDNLYLNKIEDTNVIIKGCLYMKNGAQMIVDGETQFIAGYCVQVSENAILKLNGCFFNEGARIICRNNISIGRGSGASVNTVIRDSTGHPSGTSPDSSTISSAPVKIGEHVWIGGNSIVYQGSDIGDGAIIGFGSKVSGEIPPRSMVAPQMDKIVMSDVFWFSSKTEQNKQLEEFYSDVVATNEKVELSSMPSTEMMKRVQTAMSNCSQLGELSSETDFLGRKIIDSLTIASVTAALEEEFEIKIPYYEINSRNFYSLDTIAAMIEKLQKDSNITDNTERTAEIVNDEIEKTKQTAPNKNRTDKTVVQCIFENAIDNPDHLAFIAGGKETSYGKLARMIYSYSETLRRYGVKENSNVVIQAICDVKYCALYYSCHLLGAVPVPVESRIGAERIQEIADEVNATLIISEVLSDKNNAISFGRIEQKSNFDCRIPWLSLKFPSPDSCAQILFTTGTTGKSKGVMTTHRGLVSGAMSYIETLYPPILDVFLCLFPLNHAGGVWHMNCALFGGYSFCAMDRVEDINAAIEVIRKYKVTSLHSPANIIKVLFSLAAEAMKDFVNQIEYIGFGGSLLEIDTLKRIQAIMSNSRIYNTYGASESMFISIFECSPGCNQILLGKPYNQVEIAIKNSEGRVTTEKNISGQICVKSSTVMMGYYNDEALTFEVLQDGWLLMNDIGYIDDEGNLHLEGRVDDIINIRGFKVSPHEVERIAEESGMVCESILIEAKDKYDAPYLQLLAVPKGESFSAKQLKEYLSSRLEYYRVPNEIVAVEAIQKTYNGKIDRKAYRK